MPAQRYRYPSLLSRHLQVEKIEIRTRDRHLVAPPLHPGNVGQQLFGGAAKLAGVALGLLP